MEGIERLQVEVLEMNDYNVSAIFDYLKTKENLYEKFNNKEKSIHQMYEFICDSAKRLQQKNVAMVRDQVVYIWAMTYFNKSNEELGLNKKNKEVVKTIKKQQEDEKVEEKKLEDNQITIF